MTMRPGRSGLLRLIMGGLIAGWVLLSPDILNAEKTVGHLGRFAKWQKVEVTLIGADSKGLGNPNPFEVVVDGLFKAPSGKTYTVPGFYDGDGRGGLDGRVWKVRFSADEMGRWSFRSRSKDRMLDGVTGSFLITRSAAGAADFYRWGRLEAVGTAQNKIRYLKFRDGPYWMKAGCDDPENLLGKYRNYNTLAKRKAAVDYLSGHGINSMYIMTHNLGGDDKDVWPWWGKTAKKAKANGRTNVRFDVTKLEEWRLLFEHMQERGVVVYLILEDDSAWKGYDHARYYREMVARFGYLPALIFNLGEEHNENYSLPAALTLMKQLADVDPYDHPRGIHNVNSPNDSYIDASHIDFTSIQTGSPGSRRGLRNALQHNRIAIEWQRRCAARGKRTLVINFDEGRPEHHRAAWWAAYLAGGVWEAHVVGPYDRPMSAWKKTWSELGGARTFMESLPFWEMQPHNEVVKSGRAFCLAKPGNAYALYLPVGGAVSIELAANVEFDVAWWSPSNGVGGQFTDGGHVAGGRRSFTPPAKPAHSDWALRLLKRSSTTAADRTSLKGAPARVGPSAARR